VGRSLSGRAGADDDEVEPIHLFSELGEALIVAAQRGSGCVPADNGAWGRPSSEDLRHDLREVTRKMRPEWELAAAGLRKHWEAGQRDDFWPYGRSMRDVLAVREG